MKNRIYPIYHQSREILYTDWCGISDLNEFLDAIRTTTQYVVEHKIPDRLEIVDLTGSALSLEVYNEMKKAAILTKPYNRRKAVVVEISESRMLMLKFLNLFSNEKIHAFRTLDEAKDWIVRSL